MGAPGAAPGPCSTPAPTEPAQAAVSGGGGGRLSAVCRRSMCAGSVCECECALAGACTGSVRPLQHADHTPGALACWISVTLAQRRRGLALVLAWAAAASSPPYSRALAASMYQSAKSLHTNSYSRRPASPKSYLHSGEGGSGAKMGRERGHREVRGRALGERGDRYRVPTSAWEMHVQRARDRTPTHLGDRAAGPQAAWHVYGGRPRATLPGRRDAPLVRGGDFVDGGVQPRDHPALREPQPRAGGGG